VSLTWEVLKAKDVKENCPANACAEVNKAGGQRLSKGEKYPWARARTVKGSGEDGTVRREAGAAWL